MKFYCRTFQFFLKHGSKVLNWREPELIEGEGCIKTLPKILKKKNISRPFIITDKGIIKAGLLNEFLSIAKDENLNPVIFDSTVSNPTIDNINEAYKMYIDNKCDAIIGFGGGSSIDCAKGAAAKLSHPKKDISKMAGLFKAGRIKMPLIAVPTTSGTGSEATVAAVITDSKKHHKYAINDLHLIPDLAVLDPGLTLGLPKFITATTGMDALCHAVEAFIGRSNTLKTRKNAVEAVKLILDNILVCFVNGNDLAARENLQIASYKAGLAFTRAYVGNIHAVSHTLSGRYSTPHGLANAVIMPYVLEYYGKAVYKPLSELADAAGINGKDDRQKAIGFINTIKDFNKKMGIPDKISDLKKEDIPSLIKFAKKEANPLYPVPVIFNSKDFNAIYHLILNKE